MLVEFPLKPERHLGFASTNRLLGALQRLKLERE
jgi:hypothetical protein